MSESTEATITITKNYMIGNEPGAWKYLVRIHVPGMGADQARCSTWWGCKFSARRMIKKLRKRHPEVMTFKESELK